MKKANAGNLEAQVALIEKLSGDCSDLPFASKNRNLYLHEAASQGYAPAQYQLAILYKMGETLPRNYKESMKWLKMSAEQKYMPAEYELAKRYKKGSLFVKEDPKEFLFWLMRAGFNGSDKAAEELGYLYEKGIFVPENKIEAYKWYSLSTHKDSHKLDLLELSMTTEEVERAQNEASLSYQKIAEKMKKEW
ncbi:MAG: sel1 repeat family protein, partial [Alphaproteobacteria bacterium]|nr:sel1 repeat family protein [Alphaproteobacteria bacterium]